MGVTWRLRLARAVLAWEGFWPAFWPASATLLVFLVLAAFDLLPWLPGLAHTALLVVALAGLGWGGFMAWQALRRPDLKAARRRLERDSGLAHRPLEVLQDRLAGSGTDGRGDAPAQDPMTLALWELHRRRMAAAVQSLRLAWPRAGLAKRDPYALRVGLMLLLLVGVVAAGEDFWPRLRRAVVPEFDKQAAIAMTGVDLWINPPDYTGVAPIYLGTDAQHLTHSGLEPGKPIPVPSGSTVLAQVHGGRKPPQLLLDSDGTDFTALDASDFTATAKIGQARHLSIQQSGAKLADYDLQIIPDLPPTAEFRAPPSVTTRGALHLDYLAKDDYGVKSVALEIKRPDSDDPPLEIPLQSPGVAQTGGTQKEVKGSSFQDLTPHPWAGLPVELRLVARDAIDQRGFSPPVKMTLPERHFHNPIAKAIIDQRKLLAEDPSQEDVVAETLGDLAARPVLFRNDVTVFLALRSAARRLELEPGKEIIPGLEQQLWETALRVEEGDEPDAQKALREAEQALQDALDHDASEAEINRLMSELRQAVQRYLQDMVKNAENGQEEQPQSGQSRALTQQDINRLMDRMQQMSRSGAKDAAREALAQLQDMLENLRAGRQAQQGDGPAEQAMRGMQDLAKRQQQLMDRSYREAQRNRNGQSMGEDQQGEEQQGGQQQGQQQGQQGQQQGQQGQPGQRGQRGQRGQSGSDQDGTEQGDLAGTQNGLRRELGQLQQQLGQDGDVGQALDRAGQAMRDAFQALKNKAPGEAVTPQGEALDQLQQAARALADQMRQNGQDGQGSAQAGRDPFGRNLPGQGGDMDRGDVKIPEDAEMQKSREILDELRRRAADRARPQLEREYIDRLLKRF
jgi:uncharacterized protein (TIGR02302 family)